MDQGPYLPVVERREAERPILEERELEFRFTGNASEYFRIWIINVLLTLVTLGVYSAWAKIRNKQYFYRNTWLDGTSFDYVAKPLPILKGRIIAAVALGALFLTQHYSPILYSVLLIAYVIATPWVVVKALAFNARNSSFRNIRFAFAGRPGEALGAYFSALFAHALSCGLGYPYAVWRVTRFVVTRHLYGDLEFAWSRKYQAYYGAYVRAFLVAVPIYAVIGPLFFYMLKGSPKTGFSPGMLPAMGLFYAGLLVPAAFLRASVSNLLYGGIHIGEHSLSSRQQGLELLKLYATNLVAVIFSLGLLIPWAKVRLAAYRAQRLSFHAVGELSAQKLLEDNPGALGEGLTDLGDFDIGIGV